MVLQGTEKNSGDPSNRQTILLKWGRPSQSDEKQIHARVPDLDGSDSEVTLLGWPHCMDNSPIECGGQERGRKKLVKIGSRSSSSCI